MKVQDISDVLGPGWSQNINYKKRLVLLTYSCSSDLMIALSFDKNWSSFTIVHEVPKKPPHVLIEYANEYEPFYYGLYLVFACQRPFRMWVQSIKECKPDDVVEFDEN